MGEFTFYDYLDADGDGTNVIKDWLNGNGKPGKAYFNRIINYLEGSPPAGSRDSVWHHPYTWPLKGKWKGFFEIRKETKNVQYRLIGKIEGRCVFLVATGFHQGTWETDVSPETGKERSAQMKNNPAKYRREHDNS